MIDKIDKKIKGLMAENDFTLEKLANALNEKYGLKESKQNLSNKFKTSLKFELVDKILDVMGYELKIEKKA